MKKLLGLTFILTSLVAVADPQGSTDKTADMSITARVIQPLTVEAQPMAFGKIIKDNEATANSTFTITGEPSETVSVTIPQIATLTNSVTKTTMDVNVTTSGAFSANEDGGTSLILKEGANIINVKGTLPAGETGNTGTFAGTLTATVRYN